MNEQQLETLLRQMPAAKAPAGMKINIMQQLQSQQVEQHATPTSNWPEKSLLIMSLLAGCISLIWLIDFDFVTSWMATLSSRTNALFSQNMTTLNQTAGLAGDLPVYVLSVTLVIGGLLLLERLILRRVMTHFSLI